MTYPTHEELSKTLLTLKDDTSITNHLVRAFENRRIIYHPIGERVVVCLNPGRLDGFNHDDNIPNTKGIDSNENVDEDGNQDEDESGDAGGKVDGGVIRRNKEADRPRDIDVLAKKLADFILPLSSSNEDVLLSGDASDGTANASSTAAIAGVATRAGKSYAGRPMNAQQTKVVGQSTLFPARPSPAVQTTQPSRSTVTPTTHRGHRQTIIALGESGSGKSTVMRSAIRQAMTSIRSGSPGTFPVTEETIGLMPASTSDERATNDHESELMDRLDRSLRIAEVLGNATTKNNADSSRMGKLIQIWKRTGNTGYDFTLRALMIEDTRLGQLRPSTRSSKPIATANPERAFHIFYVLAAGGHPAFDQFPDLLLPSHRDFDQIESARIYHSLSEDFVAIGWQDPLKIWNGIAAVWLLVRARSFDDPKVELAREYLEVESAFDCKADLARYAKEHGKSASSGTDALSEADELFVWAKIIYRKIFLQLVSPATIKQQPDSTDILSFVDICGFEILQENQLQQLLINLCNERLFETYKTIAMASAPDRSGDETSTGRPVPKRTPSVTGRITPTTPVSSGQAVLERVLSVSTTDGLSQSLRTLVGTRSSAPSMRFQPDRPDGLEIPHLDNLVRYHWTEFVGDNIDGVRPERMNACRLFQHEDTGLTSTKVGPPKPLSKNRSVVRAYQRDLREIVDTVVTSDVLFLRCIKAHPELVPWTCDNEAIHQQVKHLGLLATLDFVRDLPGSCVSTIEQFRQRYITLVPSGHLEDIFKLGAKSHPIAAVFHQRPPMLYYSENAKQLLDGLLREIEEKKARAKAEEETRRVAAEQEALRKAAEAEAFRKAEEAEVIRKAEEAEALQKIAEAESLRQAVEEEANRQAAERERVRQAEEKDALRKTAEEEACRQIEIEKTRINSQAERQQQQLARQAAEKELAKSKQAVSRSAQHSMPGRRSSEDLNTFNLDAEVNKPLPTKEPSTLATIAARTTGRFEGHRVVSAPHLGADPFTPIPTVKRPSKPHRIQQSFFLNGLLQTWTDSTEEIAKHAIEAELIDTILGQIERASYTKGPSEGRSMCMDIHCFLECEFQECFRNTQYQDYRLKSQRVYEISLMVMVSRVVKSLRDHYTLLTTLSRLTGATQSCRARAFGIQMTKEIEDEIESRPSVWSYMASRADGLLQEMLERLERVQERTR